MGMGQKGKRKRGSIMINPGSRRYGNPVLLSNGKTVRPKRIPFTEKQFDEGWLQELIRANPEILPVDEIEPAFAPLVAVGREVPTAVGPVDNLYLSPQGYLTIVETKLWRNPEARREVVGQIIDYAKEIRQWSFEDLEERVRDYNRQFRDSEDGILDTLRRIEQIDEADEQFIVDAISGNLRRGRFLLLIVGDGIRESVEAMADFLAQTPQLYFTLALVELQVYELDEGRDKSLLIIPQLVTRTREITRAIVRVEGKATESIDITVDMPEEEPPGGKTGPRSTLTEDDFFNILKNKPVKPELVKFAGRIMDDMRNLGCIIDWKQSAYVVKMPDPGESGRMLTLFVVTKNGTVFPGWMSQQLRAVGLSEDIAYEYAQSSARLFKNCEVHKKQPDKWSRDIPLEEFRQNYDKFVSLVQKTMDIITDASDNA